MAIVIRKTIEQDGSWYEIENFEEYVRQLVQRGIEAPKAKYRIFVSADTQAAMGQSIFDLPGQLGLFFRLGPASGIDFVIREAADDADSTPQAISPC